MFRAFAFLALAAACLGFTPATASAQLFRRAAPCPSCPNGVCQPQPSGPMFAPVSNAVPMPGAPAPVACFPAGAAPGCPCSAGCNCTSLPPGGPGYYVCPRTAGQTCPVSGLPPLAAVASRLAPAGSCTAGPSAGGFGSGWYPGRWVGQHRPHLIFR